MRLLLWRLGCSGSAPPVQTCWARDLVASGGGEPGECDARKMEISLCTCCLLATARSHAVRPPLPVPPPTMLRSAPALTLPLLLACGLLLGRGGAASTQGTPAAFMRGAAMGLLPTLDCNGTCSQYRANASAPSQDALQILADYGLNTARLRLFGPDAAPNNSYAALDSVLAMARRAHAAGLDISLDIFYSQWYQGAASYYLQRRTPPRWRNLSFPALVEAAANFTADAVAALAAQGTAPTTVQIGNEINCGIFHPWQGTSCDTGAEVCSCKGNWANLARVINASAAAVKRVNPEAEVIIQFAASKQLGDADAWHDLYNFYTQLAGHGTQFDALGLSFYQIWGAANVSNLCNLAPVARALPEKRIYVIETGYPYKAGGHAPGDMKPAPQFPLTPAGEEAWLRAVTFTVEHGLWGRGAGVSWWGAEYAARCSGDECAGFWDEHFVGLPVMTNRAIGPTRRDPLLSSPSPPPGAVVCPPLE